MGEHTINKASLAAEELLSRRLRGTQSSQLLELTRPLAIDEALLIQEETCKLRPDKIVGWKCLLPLENGDIIVAPIFSNTLNQGDICYLDQNCGNASIEPEIAFRLGVDLVARQGAPYSPVEIDESVVSAHMALELVRSRYDDNSGVSFFEKLADCLGNQGLYVGPEISRSGAYECSALTVGIVQENCDLGLTGKHPNNFPQLPLYWLVNHLNERGISLLSGQYIITGSYCGVIKVDVGIKTSVSYVGFGSYDVTFIETLD